MAVILQLPEGRGGTLEITDQGAPRREAVPAATTFAVSAPPVSDPGSAPVDPPPAPRRPPVAEPTADFPSEEEDPQTPVAAPVEATRGRGWMVLLGMALGGVSRCLALAAPPGLAS